MPRQWKAPVWTVPLVIAGLVALLGWWANGRLREIIEGQLRAQLRATLKANVTALEIWAANQTRLATSLADDSGVRQLANRLLAASSSPPDSRRQEQEQFIHELRPRLNTLGYRVAQLVGTNYEVMANSMRMTWVGHLHVSDAHTNKFAELFATGKPVIITPFKPGLLLERRGRRNLPRRRRGERFHRFDHSFPNHAHRSRRGDFTLMQVAAPVRDMAGKVAGALALIINPDMEFSRILSVARSGNSGETYAFDQTGLMISRSRFDAQLKRLGLLAATNTSSALNLRLADPGGDLTKGYQPTNSDAGSRPLISLVSSALDGLDSVEVNPVRDYRGVPVVGASRWLPQFGFGVATQIDAAEAYRPLRVLQWIFVVLFLSLLLCATAMFVFSNLTWRRRLSEAELKLKRLGQYALEEKIGEGGMGVVYRARHALLRRDTAVKLLLPDRADADTIQRFEREVCLTCQLSHPNTIQIFDYGHTPEGIFYYAMEFLRGLNLHDLVARFGPQPEGRVIYILMQVCDSLAEAHERGLIHRDIKPANVFLCQRGGVPDCVKVLDFGLVKEFRSADDQVAESAGPHQIEGTPWFTPPEAIQAAGQIDPRSDLYSLGALGYYLLTGSYIFDAESIHEIHEKQLTAMPIPPRQRTAQLISPTLEAIILRCLAKDPPGRPQTVRELQRLLLTCPAAADWTNEKRAAWWQSFQRQTGQPQTITKQEARPMATVKIDLGSRLER